MNGSMKIKLLLVYASLPYSAARVDEATNIMCSMSQGTIARQKCTRRMLSSYLQLCLISF